MKSVLQITSSVTLKSYDILITCPEMGFAGTPPPDWLSLAIGAASRPLIGRWAPGSASASWSFAVGELKVVFKRAPRWGSVAADGLRLKMSPRNVSSAVLLAALCLLPVACAQFPTLDHIRPKASDKAQGRAVVELLKRLLGSRSTEFIVSVNRSLSVDSLDVCELRSTKNNKIVATGSTGVAVASGIYNYLKYFCNCHVSWCGDQLELPRPLPRLTGILRINTPHRSVTPPPVCFASLWPGSPFSEHILLLYRASRSLIFRRGCQFLLKRQLAADVTDWLTGTQMATEIWGGLSAEPKIPKIRDFRIWNKRYCVCILHMKYMRTFNTWNTCIWRYITRKIKDDFTGFWAHRPLFEGLSAVHSYWLLSIRANPFLHPRGCLLLFNMPRILLFLFK